MYLHISTIHWRDKLQIGAGSAFEGTIPTCVLMTEHACCAVCCSLTEVSTNFSFSRALDLLLQLETLCLYSNGECSVATNTSERAVNTFQDCRRCRPGCDRVRPRCGRCHISRTAVRFLVLVQLRTGLSTLCSAYTAPKLQSSRFRKWCWERVSSVRFLLLRSRAR